MNVTYEPKHRPTRYRQSDDSLDTKTGMAAGAVIGTVTGVVGATLATFWGGYEIGTAINDAIHLQATVGRMAVDLVSMGVIAGPCYSVGIWGGMAAGGAVGGVAGAIKSGVRRAYHGIADKINGNYD
jgi:hypothetical protein